MRISNLLLCTAALGLGLWAPGTARARSISGEMGFQSRGQIGISVSVMPRLNVGADVNRRAGSEQEVQAGGRLRYTLVACSSVCPHWPTSPAIGSKPNAEATGGTSPGPRAPDPERSNGTRMILVVPD